MKNQLNGINQSIDKRTNGYKRKKEAYNKQTTALIDLIKKACKYNIPTDYLLFDSWYAFPSVILDVLEQKFNVICMLKAIHRVYYYIRDEKYNLKEL